MRTGNRANVESSTQRPIHHRILIYLFARVLIVCVCLSLCLSLSGCSQLVSRRLVVATTTFPYLASTISNHENQNQKNLNPQNTALLSKTPPRQQSSRTRTLPKLPPTLTTQSLKPRALSLSLSVSLSFSYTSQHPQSSYAAARTTQRGLFLPPLILALAHSASCAQC